MRQVFTLWHPTSIPLTVSKKYRSQANTLIAERYPFISDSWKVHEGLVNGIVWPTDSSEKPEIYYDIMKTIANWLNLVDPHELANERAFYPYIYCDVNDPIKNTAGIISIINGVVIHTTTL